MVFLWGGNMHVIHVVSGGTGASAAQLLRTVLAQFPGVEVSIVIHGRVRDSHRLESVMAKAETARAIVVHSLVSEPLRRLLTQEAERRGLIELDFVGPLIERLAWRFEREAVEEPGRYRRLHAEYFERIDAVEFAVEHDDGRRPEDWSEADVVLVGPSRVGKTPLCMYLATHGWKAANWPLIRDVEVPEELLELPREKIVGLTIDPGRLMDHRAVRARAIGMAQVTDYVTARGVGDDVENARQFFRRFGIPAVEVTDRPVEEIAAGVMERVRR